jgi:hypothetical protein
MYLQAEMRTLLSKRGQDSGFLDGGAADPAIPQDGRKAGSNRAMAPARDYFPVAGHSALSMVADILSARLL